MSFKQFIIIPIGIAVLAVLLVMLAPNPPSDKAVPHLWTWISFQAWAMYFLAGCTLKGGVKVMLGYLGGALASIAIFELAGPLGKFLPGNWGLYAAVFIVVIGVISAERVPWFDFVPSWFIGAGVFFGVMFLNPWAADARWAQHVSSFGDWGLDKRWIYYLLTVTHLMVSCAVGQVFGIVTVLGRTRYEGWLKAKKG